MKNNFEKKVQEGLHDLQFSPSGTVWEGIEKELEKTDKRRLFFWLFGLSALLCLIMGGSYFLFLKKPIILPVDRPTATGQTITAPPVAGDKKMDDSSLPAGTLPAPPVLGKRTDVVTGSMSMELLATPVSREDGSHPHFPITIKAGSLPNYSFDTKMTFSDQADHISPVEKLTVNNDLIENDQIPDKQNVDRYPKKWRLGMTFSPGMSYLTNSPLKRTTVSPSNRPASSDPLFYPGSGPIVSGINTPPTYALPPKYRAGLSYNIGLLAKKSLDSNHAFSVGLRFRHLEIGQNSTLYFRSSNEPMHIQAVNRLNYLELPATFFLSSNLGGKTKLNGEAGAYIARLISADAQQYGYTDAQFYKDNSLLNKVQAGLQGGITISLPIDRKLNLEAGPYYHYSLSRTGKSGMFSDKHLNVAELKVRIIF